MDARAPDGAEQPVIETAPALDAPELTWAPGPAGPELLGAAARPRIVRLTAHWCQWCRVFEHEVLPRPEVRAAIARNYEPLVIDVDASPRWMDLPGIEGLPTLLFFDAQGRHLLSRSGYRDAAELELLFDVVATRLRAGELEPYPDPPAPKQLQAFTALDPARAAAELDRLEQHLYFLVNSNDGGFATPARDPHPEVLLELQRWRSRSERAEAWIELTSSKALRGHSPRIDGAALDSFELDAEQLIELSRGGPELGKRWRIAVDQLPETDPYRGLQDPFDHGVFRYCVGPGWYHPHFERRASDNLAWALLLRERDRGARAEAIYRFVVETFGSGGPLDTSQHTDPFYYRLTAAEREGLSPPPVSRLWALETQARAARYDPARCELLERVSLDWPRAHWREHDEDPSSPPATVDAVGELLFALAECPGQAERAHTLATHVLERWEQVGFVVDARLVRLAAGVCRVEPQVCPTVLATVEGLPIDLRFGPPLAELAAIARVR